MKLFEFMDAPDVRVFGRIYGDTPLARQINLGATDIPVESQLSQSSLPYKTPKPVEPAADDDDDFSWGSLETKTKVGLAAYGIAKGLEIFGTVKAGFDAAEEGEEMARHLESVAAGERAKYRRKGQEVLNREAINQAEDQAVLATSGLNFGATQQQKGQVFQNIQDLGQADANKRYQDLIAEGESLAQMRFREARLARKAGRKAKKRGILQGVGQLGGIAISSGLNYASGGWVGVGEGITGTGVSGQIGKAVSRTLSDT